MKLTNQTQPENHATDQQLQRQAFEHQPRAMLALAQLEQEIEHQSSNAENSLLPFPARFELELTEPLRAALQDLSLRVPHDDEQDLLQLVIAKGIVATLQLAPRRD